MKRYLLFFSLILAAACRQSYSPPAVANPPAYLVVEGVIENNGVDFTTFTLSRTVKLDTNLFQPETGATVMIEGTDNSARVLQDAGKGSYTAFLSGLDNSVSYRLHIHTASAKEYASDYIPVVTTPPIDSVGFKRVDNPAISDSGLQIYVNTHDPQNNTRYYRWEYLETWEFHSKYNASIKYDGNGGWNDYFPNDTYICWHYAVNNNILLGTSSQLAKDVIFQAPMVLIPLNSQQISVRYSIQVKQRALTKEAFNWWQIMQKNSEQIGSIFGVQPSVNRGNIRCLSDTAEQVIGYVSAGNTRAQRIFITPDQVQPWYYSPPCPDHVTSRDSLRFYVTIGDLPWYWDLFRSQLHVANAYCVDCSLSGTNARPSFW